MGRPYTRKEREGIRKGGKASSARRSPTFQKRRKLLGYCGSIASVAYGDRYNVQSGPEKNAQSLMHCHFATNCRRITRFLPECS